MAIRRFLTALLILLSTFVMSAVAAAATLELHLWAEPQTLDPHKMTADWPDWVAGDCFEGLLTDDAQGNPVPGQAESWSISPDGLTYTFRLRDGIQWSDGTAIAADDFVFAFRRIVDPATKADYAYVQYPIKNAEAINTGALNDPNALGVTAPDARTVVITLEQPDGRLLQGLVQFSAYPVPRHVIAQFGDDWARPPHIVCNGPYKLVEWERASVIRAMRNDRYYDATHVTINSVNYWPIEEAAGAIKRYEAGELDIVTDFPAEAQEALAATHPGEVHTAARADLFYYLVDFSKTPFDLLAVREAMSMAIDRELLGAGIAAYGLVSPGLPGFESGGYRPDWAGLDIEQRFARARQMMTEAGYGDGKPLAIRLRHITRETQKRVAAAIAANWKRIGIDVELVAAEIPDHQAALAKGDFDAASSRWMSDYADAADVLGLLRTGSPYNFQHYSNPQFDALLDRATTEQDAAIRGALLRQAEELAMKDVAAMPLFWSASRNLVSSRIGGFHDNVRDVHRTRWLTKE